MTNYLCYGVNLHARHNITFKRAAREEVTGHQPSISKTVAKHATKNQALSSPLVGGRGRGDNYPHLNTP